MKKLLLITLLTGCAGIPENVSSALEAFNKANNQVQLIADSLQQFCQTAKSELIKYKMDTTQLDTYCEQQWELLKQYRNITGKILEE